MEERKISYQRLAEVTAEKLNEAKYNIEIVYTGVSDNTNLDDNIKFHLGEAFAIIDEWQNYYNQYNTIIDKDKNDYTNILAENEVLQSENNKLQKEIDSLKWKIDNMDTTIEQRTLEVGQLRERLNMMDELMKTKDNNSNMVSIDLIEALDKLEEITVAYKEATKEAEHKAAMKVYKQRLANKEVKPAKRADVSDEYIIEQFKNGVSAYKIAKSVGMTQQAILYRIKKLKEDGLIK